jgi:hypothetical protein
MRCLRAFRQLELLFLCGTLAFLFRFGAYGEETSNISKINASESFPLAT